MTEYANLSVEAKMVARINDAASIISFANGKLVEPGHEKENYLNIFSLKRSLKVEAAHEPTEKERNKKEDDRAGFVINADGVDLNRLAVFVATFLRERKKSKFYTYADVGDIVAVVNADKVKISQRPRVDKKTYRNVVHPRGLKKRMARHVLGRSQPEKLVQMTVENLISHHESARNYMYNLFIYSKGEYPHEIESFESLDVNEFKRNINNDYRIKS